MKTTLAAALRAAEATEEALYEIVASAADAEDCVQALEHLTTPSAATRLSEVMTAAQDLARPATRPVGDAPLPSFAPDPLLYAPRPLAVAVLSTALTTVANRAAAAGVSDGIQMRVSYLGDAVELALSAKGLSAAVLEEAASDLGGQIGKDPTVGIHGAGAALRLTFAVPAPEPAQD
jgi:hypothetical protein